MLTLDYGIDRERKNVLLGKLRAQLATYFDFMTSGSLGQALAYAQASGRAGNATEFTPGSATPEQVRARLSVRKDPIMSKIFEIFVDSNEGATPGLEGSRTIPSYKEKLQEILTTTNAVDSEEAARNKRKVANCIAMHYVRDGIGGSIDQNSENIIFPDLKQIGFTNSDNPDIKNRITAYEVLHPLMQQGEKNAELLTVFFNAIPTLEMTRATPVLNIKIYSSRPVVQDGRLGAITIHKFLEGAATIPTNTNDPLRAINLASQVTASIFGETEADFQNFSLVGMELFRAPQTLQNIEATKNTQNYLAPVIDPMRPLASIKSLEIEVRPTVGLMSSKTAKLEIVLHDRSRLGEFADFVKPDRYGSSFIDLEYGWNHPDGIDIEGNQETVANPYAQLLNLTRVKEHYGISTSNFSFDEVGQVNITLNLYTRGTAEITEISIASADPNLREQLKRLEKFSREINRLSTLIFRPPQQNRSNGETENSQTTEHRQEIRGSQMLTAATDAQNMLLLNDDLFKSLRDLRETLNGVGGTNNATQQAQRKNAQTLLNHLNDLVGPPQSDQSRNVGGEIGQIQNSVNNAILETLRHINANDQGQAFSDNPYDYDIFLKRMPQKIKDKLKNTDPRHSGLRAENEQRQQLANFNPTTAPAVRRIAPRARNRR